jgi:hypothetical protein
MDEISFEQTAKTPQIDFNHLSGDLLLYGRSIPENAAKIYEPVFNWVNEYILEPRPITNLRLNLEYYNTASTIWFTKILKTLLKIKEADYVIILHLYLPVEDFDEIDDFDDIKDAFVPIANIDPSGVGIEIRLYATDDHGKIVKETLVFIESEQVVY